jgi:hypothetical protein
MSEPITVAGREYLAGFLGHDHDLVRMQICRVEAEAVAEKDSQLEALHRALEQFADDLDTDAGRPSSERTWHGDYATRLRKIWRQALESPTAVPTQEQKA